MVMVMGKSGLVVSGTGNSTAMQHPPLVIFVDRRLAPCMRFDVILFSQTTIRTARELDYLEHWIGVMYWKY
jgi:hypothetical protein